MNSDTVLPCRVISFDEGVQYSSAIIDLEDISMAISDDYPFGDEKRPCTAIILKKGGKAFIDMTFNKFSKLFIGVSDNDQHGTCQNTSQRGQLNIAKPESD